MTDPAQPPDGLSLEARPAPAEEVLPRQFGKYTLLRRLASGGMAELFLALHRAVAGFEKLVVIKRILPAMNQDKGFIEMLMHEARVAATLNHPNIVQTFDVGMSEGTHFIAMEHIHGEDIRSIVRAMKKKGVAEFPLEHALGVVMGTCAGLAYAHEKKDLKGQLIGIVHRDISPQNIVITFTGDVKVVDFGVAKSSSQVGEDTKSGQLKGKVPYMSPEQARGEEIDRRSDIFAVGVLLFELTTGRRLFKGPSEYETLKLITERDYPRPSEVSPEYPQELERIVMKSLEKDPAARYQTAREMQADLEAFVRHERIAVSAVSLAQWMQMLFEDKLAAQNEALHDIKQLADVIATQVAFESQTSPGTVTGTTRVGAAVASLPPPDLRKRPTGAILGVLGVAVVGGGVFFATRGKEPDAQATPTPAAQSATVEARGSLEVVSKPEGATIWINGDLRPEKTPAKIKGLPIGQELVVKITQEGLEPFKKALLLTSDQPDRKLEAELKKGSVTVVVKVEPPPTIWLDGKPWKGDRAKLEGLTANEEHKVVLSASGFQAKTIAFTAQQGETKTIEEKLVKLDPAQAAAQAKAGDKPDKPDEPKPPPPAGGNGKVRVGAKGGFCNVTVNGMSLGPTPVEASVPAGTARVTCKADGGKSFSQAVQVEPGGVARVSFKLD